jgi:hypothetical protein
MSDESSTVTTIITKNQKLNIRIWSWNVKGDTVVAIFMEDSAVITQGVLIGIKIVIFYFDSRGLILVSVIHFKRVVDR